MIKRIAAVTLMLGAAIAFTPAIGSAQDYNRQSYENRYRDHDDRRRDDREIRREREARERFQHDRYRAERRGFYDRFGCWHRY